MMNVSEAAAQRVIWAAHALFISLDSNGACLTPNCTAILFTVLTALTMCSPCTHYARCMLCCQLWAAHIFHQQLTEGIAMAGDGRLSLAELRTLSQGAVVCSRALHMQIECFGCHLLLAALRNVCTVVICRSLCLLTYCVYYGDRTALA